MTELNVDVEIGILGPLLVRVRGVEQEIRAAKQRQLLARLVLDAGRVVSTDQLIDQLWGESPPATVTKNLQVLVGRLRAIVGADVIATRPGGYALALVACRLDLVDFEQLVLLATDAERNGRIDDAIDAFERAADLWRGEVAEEVSSGGGKAVVARLTELRFSAVERSLVLRYEYAPGADTVDRLREVIRTNPAWEMPRVLLARSLQSSGDVARARDAVIEAVEMLQVQFGLTPGAELRSIAESFEVPVQSLAASNTVEVLFPVGAEFSVAEAIRVLRTVVGSDIAALDRLEDMVASGELRRDVDAHGRVRLTRATEDAAPA